MYFLCRHHRLHHCFLDFTEIEVVFCVRQHNTLQMSISEIKMVKLKAWLRGVCERCEWALILARGSSRIFAARLRSGRLSCSLQSVFLGRGAAAGLWVVKSLSNIHLPAQLDHDPCKVTLNTDSSAGNMEYQSVNQIQVESTRKRKTMICTV